MQLDDLNEVERQSIIYLVTNFPYQLHVPGDKLSKTSATIHKIPTTDHIPVNVKQYHQPPHLQGEIQEQIDEMIENDVIEESESTYNSPLLIVPGQMTRKDGAESLILGHSTKKQSPRLRISPNPNSSEGRPKNRLFDSISPFTVQENGHAIKWSALNLSKYNG